MKIRILILSLAFALCAGAETVRSCQINGVAVGCGLENGASLGIAPDSTLAYALTLSDVASNDPAAYLADVYVTGIDHTLQQTSLTFSSYVPGAGTNGANSVLTPYAYFTVNPYGTNLVPGGDPYALVIVATSGFASSNDNWYTDGINLDSTVHIVLGNGWTAAQAGITNPDWLSCCGDLPTLGQLLSTGIPAAGSNPAMTWGNTDVYKARVAAGNWDGTGTYVAYVGNVDIVGTPEPSTWLLMLTSLGALAVFGRRHVRQRSTNEN